METIELNPSDFGAPYNQLVGNVKQAVVVEATKRKFWWKDRRQDLISLAQKQVKHC